MVLWVGFHDPQGSLQVYVYPVPQPKHEHDSGSSTGWSHLPALDWNQCPTWLLLFSYAIYMRLWVGMAIGKHMSQLAPPQWLASSLLSIDGCPLAIHKQPKDRPMNVLICPKQLAMHKVCFEIVKRDTWQSKRPSIPILGTVSSTSSPIWCPPGSRSLGWET